MTVKEKKDLLDTLAEFYDGVIKPDLEKINHRMKNMENRLVNVEKTNTEIVQYLKSKDSPSREEFQNLKYKVDNLEVVKN
jgi:hypothetical protein